jgi:glycosyltransferase involved in cell wall biosynthesis
MKKITILALHLGYGGIESSICNLANVLCDTYDITILVTYKLYDQPVFPLDKRVQVKYLTNLKPNKEAIKESLKHVHLIKLIKELFKAIYILYLKKKTMIMALKKCDSDIIISTRIYFNNLLGKYGHSYKIAWEHNHHHGNQKYIHSFINSCKNINKVILVSNELKNDYLKYFQKQNIACECYFIPNFISDIPQVKSKLNNNNIISVGRLSKEKGYLDLIKVISTINSKYKDIHVDIVGDGSESSKIIQEIKNERIVNISLHGYQNKDYINNLYLNSSLYLMTSYTESFGLVLLEAMSYGLPCIAFSSAEGAKDIIKDGYNGYLINDRNINAMANKVINLLNNRELLTELGKNCLETVKKYDKDNIKEEWIKILGE